MRPIPVPLPRSDAAPRRAWLALGGNLGDKAGMIGAALAALAARPDLRVTARSGLYRTPPWGDVDQDWFLNAAAEVETSLAPHALLDACLAVERGLGRVRERRWGPRLIDVDIVAMEGVALADPRLILPHPHALARAFVLAPLAEIAPGLAIAGTPVAAALARLDRTGIERVGEPPGA